jgi:pyruvate formate lyase activating enzyme
MVFNIQRFSVHDGPGIRTTVFLKGCPLRCPWCNNPESQSETPEIVFWPDRCLACDACVAACPRGAVEVTAVPVGASDAAGDRAVPGRRVSSERCDLCSRCVDACYAGALERIGRTMSASEVVAAVAEDRLFYEQSGGGVTLSGGEPTVQATFSGAVLRGCREAGLRTAVESCGSAAWKVWTILLPHLDLVLLDLKEIDPARHLALTGSSNRLILANARRLAAQGIRVIVRRPLIPGRNDSAESLHLLGRFVRDLGTVEEIDLLPYHRLGSGKYRLLGRDYALGDLRSLTPEEAEPAQRLLLSYGLRVKVGG